jgi:hypothetical protein
MKPMLTHIASPSAVEILRDQEFIQMKTSSDRANCQKLIRRLIAV